MAASSPQTGSSLGILEEDLIKYYANIEVFDAPFIKQKHLNHIQHFIQQLNRDNKLIADINSLQFTSPSVEIINAYAVLASSWLSKYQDGVADTDNMLFLTLENAAHIFKLHAVIKYITQILDRLCVDHLFSAIQY